MSVEAEELNSLTGANKDAQICILMAWVYSQRRPGLLVRGEGL